MKRTRTPPHKVSKRQRASAIAALHQVVKNPAAAEYVRAKAAASIIFASKIDDGSAPDRDDDAPRAVVFLPRKDPPPGRQEEEPPVEFLLGPREDSPVVIYDSTTQEGLADCARWRSEAVAAGHAILAPQ